LADRTYNEAALNKATGDIATAVGGYYTNLIKQGVPAELAGILAKEFQATLSGMMESAIKAKAQGK
jgi:uncharacterized protein YejL (UPF0352 family)